jgi:hypothetical protein
MQELEKRLLAEAKLSNSWNEIKNEEDLILANTFYNSKKSEAKNLSSNKKASSKRVSWNEKLVQKPVTIAPSGLSATMGGKVKEELGPTKIRSILKGEIGEEKD